MDKSLLYNECVFKAVKSSGPGGQHVNKTASKIELYFNIEHSQALNDKEKQRLLDKLSTKLSADGNIILTCQDSRSQHKNKDIAFKKLLEVLLENLKVSKKRKPTKIPKSVKIKRLKSKRANSEKKANRRKPNLD